MLTQVISFIKTFFLKIFKTYICKGFGADIRAILRSVATSHNKTTVSSSTKSSDPIHEKFPSTHVIMATATLTKAVRALLEGLTKTPYDHFKTLIKTPYDHFKTLIKTRMITSKH